MKSELMKKVLTIAVTSMMVLSLGALVWADTDGSQDDMSIMPISLEPTLYDNLVSTPKSENDLPAVEFEVKYNENQFTIIIEENPSTGYTWSHETEDLELTLISDEYVAADTDLLGAPGVHKYTFEVSDNGVYTIDFKKTSPSSSIVETLPILVYKTDDAFIVEQDGIMYAIDEDESPEMDYADTDFSEDESTEMDYINAPLQVYYVESGDTMHEIAASLGMSLEELIEQNNQIEDPNLIFPGQEIYYTQG